MKLQNRISILLKLGAYLSGNDAGWIAAKERAGIENPWFTPEFTDLAVNNIVSEFLHEDKLRAWISHYHLDDNIQPRTVGIVMAGNIPLVGFHDFLCVFVSGHKQLVKLSSKDNVLLRHLIDQMKAWDSESENLIGINEVLKGCDAYIATGSNNSARYFDYYFSRYPSIIRKNRTSVAILKGDETREALEKLSDDIHVFFGLGCRNVTKIYVPEGYDFVPLLEAFHRYKDFSDHPKYRNNYDYNLSLQIMNGRYYMTNGSTLLVEQESIFSPISQLNYGYYKKEEDVWKILENNEDVQCIVGRDIPFGKAQQPSLTDYADGVDTMQFLLSL